MARRPDRDDECVTCAAFLRRREPAIRSTVRTYAAICREPVAVTWDRYTAGVHARHSAGLPLSLAVAS